MTVQLGRHLKVLAIATAVTAAIVTAAYLRLNDWSAAGALNLFVAMVWLCLQVNLGITVAYGLLVALTRPLPRCCRLSPSPRLLAGTLVAGNLTWILWNRLGMAHQWATGDPYQTPVGIAQNALLLLATLALVYLSAMPDDPRANQPAGRRRARALLLLGVAVAAYGGGLLLALREERQHRRVDLEALQRAAREAAPPPAAQAPAAQSLESESPEGEPTSAESPAAESTPTTDRSRLTVLAIDGLEWSILEPMLTAGMMPNLQALIADGLVGYLDNFDESLSPRVWSTLATGHLPAEHGIGHFLKLEVRPTRAGFPHPPFTKPSTDYFYGVFDLALKLPAAGLWSTERQLRHQRRVPSFWEVASHYGSRVGIVGGVAHLPVGEVNGFWIDLTVDLPAQTTFYPVELADSWRPASEPGAHRRGSLAWVDEGTARLVEELEYALELYERYDVDLAYFYTHHLDTALHLNWGYWTRGRFFLRDLPISWSDEVWSRSVLDNLDHPAFKGYTALDGIIGRVREARSGDLLIVSDHGWTFSGYEHMVSPEGVVILAGPSFGSGVIDLDILEVGPTILAGLGLPVSEAIAANVRSDLLPSDRAADIVAQYPPEALRPASRPEEDDKEGEIERLRALGYIN